MTVKVQFEVRLCARIPRVSLHEYPDDEQIKVPGACLAKNLQALFEDGKHSDVAFTVKGEKFDAHTAILSSRSTVLDRELRCVLVY